MSAEFEDLLRRLPEFERRLRNMVRYGKVAEVDAAKGLVKITDDGGGEGQSLTTDWIPWAETGGGIKTWRPPTAGQRVVMFSPSGNLHDAISFNAAFSNENAQPSDKGDEIKETIGASSFTMRGDKIVFESPHIVLKGNVDLGDEGGPLVHRKGDEDSDGDAAVGSATKVRAV